MYTKEGKIKVGDLIEYSVSAKHHWSMRTPLTFLALITKVHENLTYDMLLLHHSIDDRRLGQYTNVPLDLEFVTILKSE